MLPPTAVEIPQFGTRIVGVAVGQSKDGLVNCAVHVGISSASHEFRGASGEPHSLGRPRSILVA